MMQLDSNDTLAAHNAEYEAVHTVAYGISMSKMTNKSSEPTPTDCATMQPPNLTGRSLGEVPVSKP